MNKGFCASSLVMTMAAGLGYWIITDSMPPRKSRSIDAQAVQVANALPVHEPVVKPSNPAREIVEFIDLSRVFEPTGEELELEYLLNGPQEFEFLPMPRVRKEYLSMPRVVASRPLAGAAEEAASPPNGFEMLRSRAIYFVAGQLADLASKLQPLAGSQGPTLPEKTEESKPREP